MNIEKFLKYAEPHEHYETVKQLITQYKLKTQRDQLKKYDATVYRIFCKDPEINDSYIGHSIKPLSIRMYHHLKTCVNSGYKYHNKKLYKFIRANGGFQNFDVEVIEQTHMSINESRKCEQYWINVYNPTLNKIDSAFSSHVISPNQ
jgi:hypothetical protein